MNERPKRAQRFSEEIKHGAKVGHKSAEADDDEEIERGRTLSEIRHGLDKKYEEHEIEAALRE